MGRFVSEYLGLDDELDKMGVFDCVLDNDSRFLNPAGAAHRVPLQKLHHVYSRRTQDLFHLFLKV